MDFISLSNKRFSCRDYSARNVSDDEILQVLEAARLAPSACNRQPWRFIVVRDEKTRQAMLAKSRPAFMDAPVVIAAIGLHDEAWHRPSDGKDHTDVDVSIAVEHICLQASEMGLGTCWVCSFDVEATASALALKEGEEPIALIPIGYPAESCQAPEKKRKPIEEIVKFL